MTEPLPTSINFGKVTGRIVHLEADTAADLDALPEARPAVGKVTFTPLTVVSRVLGPEYTAIVLTSRVSALLEDGYLSDAEGRPGIWLALGAYSVSFTVDGPTRIPGFDIQVTADHTDAAPLDLAIAANVTPPTTVLQMVEVPFGGTEGQVLTRTADGGLAWTTPPSSV